ncbi:hypothetical protein PVAP13_9KG385006 [Panicum virgatum]|uniref:Uncharacterized protein n=1 Tax=Panicum virgatum TaxID=38727 RepID=A0A8T0NCU3_PANVG|nr:hypothetical protein PVAP13_9KG385006 [Panicum virgatum]
MRWSGFHCPSHFCFMSFLIVMSIWFSDTPDAEQSLAWLQMHQWEVATAIHVASTIYTETCPAYALKV